MRLIDADALKEELGITEDCDDCERLGAHWCVNSTWAIVCDRIESAPTVDAVPRWIPCEERLPEPNLAVLGYAPKFDNIFAVYYDSVCGWITWNPVHDEPFPSFQGEIVAWMPLPEPYKGERKDDD